MFFYLWCENCCCGVSEISDSRDIGVSDFLHSALFLYISASADLLPLGGAQTGSGVMLCRQTANLYQKPQMEAAILSQAVY